MGPVLVDVRCLQTDGGVDTDALALLQEVRAKLPHARLAGLIDRTLPALPDPARACLDLVAPAMTEAACFVQLRPGQDDPLFVARYLLDPALPSVGVAGFSAEPDLDGAVRRYWTARLDQIVPAAELLDHVAGLRSAGSGAKRRAVLAADPDAPVVHALREAGAAVFTPEMLPLPLLDPRFRHPIFVLCNRPGAARLIRLLRRFGGTAILTDSCLLAAYADDPAKARRLAEAELGRPVTGHEVEQWIASIARPPALFLAEIAEAADTLIVHSAWLAGEISHRYGRETVLLPACVGRAPPLPAWGGTIRLRAHASGHSAEACIWAVDALAFWNYRVRLDLECEPVEQARLTALAGRLAEDYEIGLPTGAASVGLFLAMRGQSSRSAALAEAAGAGLRCVASWSVAEALEPPPWVVLVPDQPSPVLLAEAILDALARPLPSESAIADHRQHARRLIDAL